MEKSKNFRLYDYNVYDGIIKSNSSKTNFNPYKDNKKFIIQAFGINEANRSASITIEGFMPFFYILVNDTWNEQRKNMFVAHLKKKVGMYYDESIISAKLITRHKLKGFDNKKLHTFIKLNFANFTVYNKVKKLFHEDIITPNGFERTLLDSGYVYTDEESETNCYIYEADIPPVLKFFHIKEINPSGWIQLVNNKIKKPTKATTHCSYEYIVNYDDIISLKDKETLVKYNICSFDIEASSSHGDFPLPIKNYKKLASNILENYNSLPAEWQNNYDCSMLKQEVLSAFKLASNNLPYISKVYPKNAMNININNNMLENLIENLINYKPADIINKNTGNTENEYIEINESDDSDVDSDDAQVAENDGTFKTKRLKKVKTYTKKEASLVELIKDTKCDNDTKLSELTKAFTNTGFPELEGDIITFIGLTFIYYTESKPYKRVIIVKGGCKIPEKYMDWVINNNVIVLERKTEKEVLTTFTKIVQSENSDVITGYNITGFDFDFMFKRSKEIGCTNEFLKLSKNKDEICINKNWRTGIEDIETNKIILASGEYNLKFIKMPGRIIIDMYIIFRKEFTLSSNKLDYTSSYFISDQVKSIELDRENNTTKIYSKNLTGIAEGSYVKFEELGFSNSAYKKGKKFEILQLNNDESSFVIDSAEELNLDNFKYNWGLAKDDVTPQEIFSLANGDDYDRWTVGKYCLGDCDNVVWLLLKVDVITDKVEMSNLCSVPLSFLLLRGQGIKLQSFVSKKCAEKNTLMPVNKKKKDGGGFEGAHVFTPKTGIYLEEPVACVDYSSLYPSAIISENLSHDSKVWTKEYDLSDNLVEVTGEQDECENFIYDNLEHLGYKYVDIKFDLYIFTRKTPKAAVVKVVNGYKICRFVQFPEGKAIMPAILEELLYARKITRKLIPQQTDEFLKNVLDKRQLSIKVTANSLYGQMGAITSAFHEPDVAACTTATGRKLLFYGREIIEKCYDNVEVKMDDGTNVKACAECVYGDSVTGETPVYIRINKSIIEVLTIEQLVEKYGDKNGWQQCVEDGKEEKLYINLNSYLNSYLNSDSDSDINIYIESWTNDTWTRLERIIKHKFYKSKNIIRVLTHTGLIDVTDDHSLLLEDGNIISPKDVKIGTKLLHKSIDFNPEFNLESNSEDIKKARILGNYFGRNNCKNCEGLPIINGALYIRKAFWEGLCQVYNNSASATNDDIIINLNSQICAANICLLANSVGYQTFIDITNNNPNTFIITCTKNHEIECTNAIRKILNVTEHIKSIKNDKNDKNDLYVYDLTTNNHHFAAGIGNMIVHNTDSVFFKFNLRKAETGEKIVNQQALIYTIQLAKEAGQLASKFLKQPHDLEYEKTFWPWVLLSKKRYVGILYEEDPNKGKMKYMGIVLKRRDNAALVKDIYGGSVDIIMREKSMTKAIKFVHESIENLIAGNYPLEKLLVTKALRGYYKNPKQIAHKVLAERIGARDSGNKPATGDRMYYAYIKHANKKALQGEKIETPDYIIENNMPLDFSHYITNQIMKPLLQLFALDLENINEFKKTRGVTLQSWKSEIEKLRIKWSDPEKFNKKYEELRCKEVKTLIFDKYLKQLKT